MSCLRWLPALLQHSPVCLSLVLHPHTRPHPPTHPLLRDLVVEPCCPTSCPQLSHLPTSAPTHLPTQPLQDSVVEPLLPHFLQFYEQDEQLTPPLKLELCARVQARAVGVGRGCECTCAGGGARAGRCRGTGGWRQMGASGGCAPGGCCRDQSGRSVLVTDCSDPNPTDASVHHNMTNMRGSVRCTRPLCCAVAFFPFCPAGQECARQPTRCSTCWRPKPRSRALASFPFFLPCRARGCA